LWVRLILLRKLQINTEKGPPGDESGWVFQQGKALKGKNPMSGSGVKQSRTVW